MKTLLTFCILLGSMNLMASAVYQLSGQLEVLQDDMAAKITDLNGNETFVDSATVPFHDCAMGTYDLADHDNGTDLIAFSCDDDEN